MGLAVVLANCLVPLMIRHEFPIIITKLGQNTAVKKGADVRVDEREGGDGREWYDGRFPSSPSSPFLAVLDGGRGYVEQDQTTLSIWWIPIIRDRGLSLGRILPSPLTKAEHLMPPCQW